MTATTVLTCAEPTQGITVSGALNFLARTRRQLDRFGELPGTEGRVIDPHEAREIRRLCNELEADIKARLSDI
ncbi:MAG TPA: hypothetical protein VMH80_03715 [Bryobacteraceae bacterium]|nr:hypothetical protein [Bryobacteraceae bacterium]